MEIFTEYLCFASVNPNFMKTSSLFVRSVTKIFVFLSRRLVNAFMYYALSFNTNDMVGDPYFNFLLLGILEFPSYGVLFLSMRYLGRRTILVVLMLVGGAACLLLLAVPEGEYSHN